MSDNIVKNYNQLRQNVIEQDRRFTSHNGKLCFEGVDVEALAKKYGTPFYVFSEPEIVRNIKEIEQAFSAHANTKTFLPQKHVR